MSTPRIYNRRKGAETPPPDAVYVGRAMPRLRLKGSPWGNPFKLEHEEDRERVIAQFREYALERLQREPDWLEPLRGKDLVCWCQSPSDPMKKACHAEILRELANRPNEGSSG